MPFPFSDLSGQKLRPALMIASADRDDWLMCQITSKPYGDTNAIQLGNNDLKSGTLNLVSYARPLKLFTANQSLITKQVATVSDEKFREILESLVKLLQSNLPSTKAIDEVAGDDTSDS